jgi:hypothetical protein
MTTKISPVLLLMAMCPGSWNKGLVTYGVAKPFSSTDTNCGFRPDDITYISNLPAKKRRIIFAGSDYEF